MATIKRRQFLVGHELAAPRRLHALAYRRPFLVRQAQHVATPAFDFVDRLLDLTEQFVRQGGDAFEEILQLRVHVQNITCDVAKIYSTAFTRRVGIQTEVTDEIIRSSQRSAAPADV